MLGSLQSLNCLLIGQLILTSTVLKVTSPKKEQFLIIGLDDVGVCVGVGVGVGDIFSIVASILIILQIFVCVGVGVGVDVCVGVCVGVIKSRGDGKCDARTWGLVGVAREGLPGYGTLSINA
jgi:hypothetical protein